MMTVPEAIALLAMPAIRCRGEVDVPAAKFVLKNGFTLIVHEDKAAQLVAVNIWYHFGSKNEPEGHSGFAHLFEHLVFNGSAHFDDGIQGGLTGRYKRK
jgi:zinc protease